MFRRLEIGMPDSILKKMLLSLMILVLLTTVGSSYLLIPEIFEVLESDDQMCETDKYLKGHRLNNFVFTKFTGVRVFKVFTVTSQPFNIEKSVQLVYCEDGKKVYQKRIIQEDKKSNDIYWKESFPIQSGDKMSFFKLSRRDGYINHDKTYVLPGSVIGGLFQCYDSNCTTISSRPLLPVYSYTHKKMWTETIRGHSLTNWTIHKYIPLVSTSNDNINSKQQLKYFLSDKKRHRAPKKYVQDLFEKG